MVDVDDGFLADASHLILDRDTKFTSEFKVRLKENGVEPVTLPARSPHLNAYAERFVRTIKSECLSKMNFFGQASLDRAIREFAEHYHDERNHQGLDNELISAAALPTEGEVVREERLGGLPSFYRRAALKGGPRQGSRPGSVSTAAGRSTASPGAVLSAKIHAPPAPIEDNPCARTPDSASAEFLHTTTVDSMALDNPARVSYGRRNRGIRVRF